jgi:UDP-3-O-[3-hydroxymyristoyl] glucosamine N-acyltransferase
MGWRLSQLAERFGLRHQGDDAEIRGVNTLEAAGSDEVAFLANPKYASLLDSTGAGAVILQAKHAGRVRTSLVSDNPYYDFARIARLFARPEGHHAGINEQSRIHPDARVASGATLYPGVHVGPRTSIGEGAVLFSGVYVAEDCRIGEGCILYPGVTVLSRTDIGRRVILHPGVVLGSDGFGFAQGPEGLEKVPQLGRVIVEDDVEIGANSTVDRAALGETRIGRGTKIDNLVQIGHNVHIGTDCVLVAQVGIAGSTRIGNRVVLAGQVGLSGHLEIGDDCRVGAQSGVSRSIPAGSDVSGSPAMDHRTFLRSAALQPKLPEMHSRLKKLESQLSDLRDRLKQKGEDDG